MKYNQPIDLRVPFEKVLGDKVDNYTLPPPSFTTMQCEVIAYDEPNQVLIARFPVLEQWCNPYGMMQGGMIDAAIDNAVGPLSLLIAPASLTRTIETKFIESISLDVKYMYITARLVETKKRRLVFEANVSDKDQKVYAKSKITNFIVEKKI